MFKKNCLLGFVEVFFSLTICLLIQLDDFYLLFLGAYLCICTLTWCGRELALSPLLRRVSFLLSCYTAFPASWCALQTGYPVLPQSLHQSARITNVTASGFFVVVVVFNKLLGSNLSFPSPLSSTIRLCNLVGSCL